MQFLNEFIKSFVNVFNKKTVVYSVGPNNFAELLEQFDQPAKLKTTEQVVMTTFYTEKFTKLELDFLKNSPCVFYYGSSKVNNFDGTINIDFVPCSVRPEVLYCCYGKN